MKLIVPYFNTVHPTDARLMELAAFMGLSCEAFPLAPDVSNCAAFWSRALCNGDECVVINPRVLKEWCGNLAISEWAPVLASSTRRVLVHCVCPDAFDADLITVLSGGRLCSVQTTTSDRPHYKIAKDTSDICGAFSGLEFGRSNPSNDSVFTVKGGEPGVRPLILIDGKPFMSVVRFGDVEIVFVGSRDVLDLESEATGTPITEYFSRLVPHAMVLRYIGGTECWYPNEHHAAVIIDDPLLRQSYGFLHFESLLRLAEQHNFHSTIAFIPHNCRRTDPAISRMFRKHPNRLSICYHGNDHMASEFASTDAELLNTIVHIAQQRMSTHQTVSGLYCDRVMVFPQGAFSIEAMKALKASNFHAAVNTVSHPHQQWRRLTIRELAQPAVLRYGGFPLFLRKSVNATYIQDLAFNLFFGRPILIGEHHDIFQEPERLVDIIRTINSVASDIHWGNLEEVVANSYLTRRASNGTWQIRAYSATVQIKNRLQERARFVIKWPWPAEQCSSVKVLKDERPWNRANVDESGVEVAEELDPGGSAKLSLVHHNYDSLSRTLGIRRHFDAFIRRRLSEVRDNYLYKSPHALRVVAAFKRYTMT